jgi:Zn-dependent peptidase ImmA (M78 family)
MSDEFVITDDRLSIIADTFGIEKGSVEKLHREFSSLEVQIKNHYLAHICRVLEVFFKEKTGNREFFIECKPYRINAPGQRGAISYYFRFHKFAILYDSTLPERERRINIAHELGHLYLLARYYAETGVENEPKFEKTTEPLCSIFGLFTISDKNHFYQSLRTSGRDHDSWQKILDDFINLNKPAGS